MITIRKDKVEKIVTLGAYEEMYKNMGYEPIEQPKAKSKNEKNDNTSTKGDAQNVPEENPKVQQNADTNVNKKQSESEK